MHHKTKTLSLNEAGIKWLIYYSFSPIFGLMYGVFLLAGAWAGMGSYGPAVSCLRVTAGAGSRYAVGQWLPRRRRPVVNSRGSVKAESCSV